MARTRGVSASNLPENLLAKLGPGAPLRDGVSTRRPRRDLEHQEQVALFRWAAANEGRIPELRLLHAIPNFSGRLGRATARHGARLRAEGRKPGVPDVCLPVPRAVCSPESSARDPLVGTWTPRHGLYIEFKSDSGRLTPAQRWWLTALDEQGYVVAVARGWESARNTILHYLGSVGTNDVWHSTEERRP